jgi:hypothetical protein
MDTEASLMELLQRIQDPRGAKGKRHPLPALLGLAVVAMLAGMTSYEAIAQYGRERGREFLYVLGFTRGRGLCKATYSRVFRRIDVAEFERCVSLWVQGRLGNDDAPQIAIDGKTARGSRDKDAPAVHLVAAYAPDVHATVAQLRVDAKTNEHKAALELLGILPIKGKIVTGDAMFTHRDVCTAVIRGGGDYILPAKDNQPTLRANIAAVFTEPRAGLSPPPVCSARVRNRAGIGDRQRPRPRRGSHHRGDVLAGRVPAIRLARLRPGLSADTATQDRRDGGVGGGLGDYQSTSRASRAEAIAESHPKPLGN